MKYECFSAIPEIKTQSKTGEKRKENANTRLAPFAINITIQRGNLFACRSDIVRRRSRAELCKVRDGELALSMDERCVHSVIIVPRFLWVKFYRTITVMNRDIGPFCYLNFASDEINLTSESDVSFSAEAQLQMHNVAYIIRFE